MSARLAAIGEGRRFIGVEVTGHYASIARQCLTEAAQQPAPLL